MTRLIVTLLSAGALWAAATLAPSEPEAAPCAVTECRPAPAVEQSCKPVGPIEITLDVAETRGSRIDLDYGIRPVRDLVSVDWELQYPSDTSLVDGNRSGSAAAKRDAVTAGRVQLDMPEDGHYRAVRLVARGVFKGSDETGATFDEPFVVTKSVTWGEPVVNAPIVLTPDDETGELVQVIAMPTRHTPSRR